MEASSSPRRKSGKRGSNATVRRSRSARDDARDEFIGVDMAELKRMFLVIDTNSDGLISEDDLRHFMEKLGFTTSTEEVSAMVRSVDTNGDGCVDLKEFASLYKIILSSDSSFKEGAPMANDDDDMKEAFHVFDKNNDGYISPAELQSVLLNLGMIEGECLTDCEKMIQTLDVDGNGRIDFGEFKRMMSADLGELLSTASCRS